MTRSALRNWFLLPRVEQFRTLEAASLLTAAWLAVRLMPFRWYAPVLGRCGDATTGANRNDTLHGDCLASSASMEQVARVVGRSLSRAARHLPWRSTCLMHALAGKVMLRRRRCPGIVFVGVARRDGERFGYHAWLLAGAVWVSGRIEAPDFTVVATFR